MRGRRFVPLLRVEMMRAVTNPVPFRSRAKDLVESGLDRCAAHIAEITHSLTDSAMQAMLMEVSEQGGDVAVADVAALRSALFMAIGRNIIDRIEQRVW